MEMFSPPPSMGRIVFVTLDVNQLIGGDRKIVERAADVVSRFPPQAEPWPINVSVRLDGPNDTPAEFHRYGSPPSHRWLGSVTYDPTGEKVPSWRWPPRVG